MSKRTGPETDPGSGMGPGAAREVLVRARRALHGVAELVLAGPQYRAAGTIRLRAVDGGFATVATPALRVDGAELVLASGRRPLAGATCAELADAAGVDVGAPGNYADGSGVSPEDRLDVAPEAASLLAACFARGDAAMRRLAPELTPVLWPEHFDVGITLDEVNYGVSPGDDAHPEPYAYVGPHRPRTGTFWNAPFGAARPMSDLRTVDALVGFFTEGRRRAAEDPVAG
jgi:hypothetical protein